MPTIKLDQDRPLKWTMRTDYKLGGLSKPPRLSDLSSKDGRKAFHALCCFVWACVHEGPAIDSPEDVAEYLDTSDKQTAAIKALCEALEDSGLMKKKAPEASS